MTRYNIREAVLVVIILALAYAGGAQDKGAVPTTAPRETRVADNTEPPSGPHEGIKVHGHWTIVVKNSDGSIATQREFENALQVSEAAPYLAKVLGRTTTVGYWDIVLTSNDPNNGTPCIAVGFAGPIRCHVSEPKKLVQGGASTNLTVTVGNTLIFAGSFTATANGKITTVGTLGGSCQPTLTPAATCVGYEVNFTAADISPAITVQTGQEVLVKVEISFS